MCRDRAAARRRKPVRLGKHPPDAPPEPRLCARMRLYHRDVRIHRRAMAKRSSWMSSPVARCRATLVGRPAPGRRSQGRRAVREENQTVASITFQNYFRIYTKLAGMTGTADTEAFEFQQIYGLEVVVIPTHQADGPRRSRGPGLSVTEATSSRRSSTTSATACSASSRCWSAPLRSKPPSSCRDCSMRRASRHQVLNAKQHEREAHIVAQAGRPGTVTIATNMAGRGTDIVLGGNLEAELHAAENPAPRHRRKRSRHEWDAPARGVVQAGGLHIVGTERHESRRIDNQLRGRSGRQGDPGSSRFYLSLEDNLMRIFGDPNRTKRCCRRVGMKEGEVIESRMLSRQIETRTAQGRGAQLRCAQEPARVRRRRQRSAQGHL